MSRLHYRDGIHDRQESYPGAREVASVFGVGSPAEVLAEELLSIPMPAQVESVDEGDLHLGRQSTEERNSVMRLYPSPFVRNHDDVLPGDSLKLRAHFPVGVLYADVLQHPYRDSEVEGLVLEAAEISGVALNVGVVRMLERDHIWRVQVNPGNAPSLVGVVGERAPVVSASQVQYRHPGPSFNAAQHGIKAPGTPLFQRPSNGGGQEVGTHGEKDTASMRPMNNRNDI